jgi:hypothetical protein
VIASDGEFFTMTVVAAGRSIGTWVDGFPVSRFDDARPEGDDAVKAARLGAGPITLQAHDPTTNLDFRALRIARLPAR